MQGYELECATNHKHACCACLFDLTLIPNTGMNDSGKTLYARLRVGRRNQSQAPDIPLTRMRIHTKALLDQQLQERVGFVVSQDLFSSVIQILKARVSEIAMQIA